MLKRMDGDPALNVFNEGLDVRELAAQPKFAEDKKMEKYVRKVKTFFVKVPRRRRRHHIYRDEPTLETP